MKHVIVVGDGMAGNPLEELGGKTPLQVADKPNIDWVASNGKNGFLKNIPNGMQPNSDVAMMSILGYDPREYYTGRGPLEAAGMNVELEGGDMAFRCNLITERDGVIEDYSAGHVSTEEAGKLIEAMSEEHSGKGDFYVGVSYRNLFVLRNPDDEAEELLTRPPHEIVGESFEENLIEPGSLEIARTLNEMILDSRSVLSSHSVNRLREEEGKRPANAIWLWGQGKKLDAEPFQKRYGVQGAVISAVTLVKGLGAWAGMDMIEVPGATGFYDTSYENKAEYGLEALEDRDLVLIHVEAPDEAGHAGDVQKKIEAIENIDQKLVRNILDGIDEEFSISVMADHPTPIEVRNHVSEPVPFSFYSTNKHKDDVSCFDEFSAKKGSMETLEGHEFMDEFISD